MHLIERTLRRLIDEQARQRPRQVEPNPPSVVERMTMILSVLRDTWSLLFSSLTAGDLRRYVRSRPDDPRGYEELARCLALMGESRAAEAQERLARYVASGLGGAPA